MIKYHMIQIEETNDEQVFNLTLNGKIIGSVVKLSAGWTATSEILNNKFYGLQKTRKSAIVQLIDMLNQYGLAEVLN